MRILLPQSLGILAKLASRHSKVGGFRIYNLLSVAAILLISFGVPQGAHGQGSGDWTWTGGSSTAGTTCVSTYPCGQIGVYGTKGTIALGNDPGSRSDAMSWTDATGHKWMFGGFGYDANGALGEQNDLWQANAAGNGWGWMSGSKGAGHSGVYGTPGTPSATNIPGGREGAATWTDKGGNLWLFGGLGYDGSGTNTYGYENDLWMYNPSTNQWTWESGSSTVPAPSNTIFGTFPGVSSPVYGTLDTPASGNTPGGRTNTTAWTDSSGNLWLFGGGITDSEGFEDVYNDLWEFNTTTKLWVWVGGGDTLNELGVYGTLGTASSGNFPGARYLASGWTDNGGNFWLFGGSGYTSNAGEYNLNDLWKFSTSTSQWTWMGGAGILYPCNFLFSTPCPVPGTYGTQGTAASTNFPGGRNASVTWTDSSGNLWLFGGSGQDANNYGAWLNDLWEYNPVTTYWTWMGGSSTVPASCVTGGTGNCGQSGVYGSLGSAASANVPGARQTAVSWTDQSGDFWLFGGWGVDEHGVTAYLNDMWEYQPAGATTTPQAAIPAFSLATGTYSTTQTVSITDSTPNAIIYYTTNDTTPTTSSTIYNGTAITVSSTETIEAIATASGYTQSAVASATYTITPVVKTAPTVTVSPSPSSITTAQGLTVTVTVAGTPTPTGSVVLTSGSYTSASTTLSSGSATINVPAGSLAKGSDTLTASYTPDTASSSTYTNATGTSTETVSAAATAPTVTVTPSPASITTAQGLTVTVTVAGTPTPTGSIVLTSGSYTSASTTLSSGSATINIFAGVLSTGTDTLTATYTPDSNSSGAYNAATGTTNVAVSNASQAASSEWIWVGGSSTVPGLDEGQPGVYGTLGTPAAGNIPGGRDGASSWTDNSGNLWYFGGQGDDAHGNVGSLNDLWKFNPTTNQWTWINGSNTVVSNSGASGVYGTLGTAAAANMPGGRQGATSWTDNSGNLWLFGGLGFDANGVDGYLNDVWKFNPSTNQWTWMAGSNALPGTDEGLSGIYGTLGTAAAGNIPGGRFAAASWSDGSGHLWLFGGRGAAGGVGGDLNDLWEFNPSTNQWAWMGGSNTIPTSTDGNGGNAGVYGTLGAAAAGNIPGSRYGASTWTDGSGNLWLFGGYGDDAGGTFGYLNDFWEFNTATNNWTWMGGSSTEGSNCPVIGGLGGLVTCGQRGAYGTFETPAAGNIPGARFGASHWTDTYGHLWLSGGYGFDLQGGGFYLNDLWEYVLSTNQWTWMGGASAFGNSFGLYGTLNIPAPLNMPGSRYSSSTWTDNNGNLRLFGGLGYDANGVQGNLNDLWSYQPSPTILPVAAAPTLSLPAGTYTTTQTVTISDTTPGATIYYTINGDIPTSSSLVYAGAITISPTETLTAIAVANGYFTSPYTRAVYTLAQATATPGFGLGAGTYSTAQSVTITDSTPGATIYYTTNGTTPTMNSAVYAGTAIAISSTETLEAVAIAPSFSISAVASATYTISAAAGGTNEWAWISGSDLGLQQGVYGTLGVASSTNSPGGRSGAASWTDGSGNLWLFGGDDLNDFFTPLNDLWEFNPKTNEWTWMGGSAGSAFTSAAPGVYGTLGAPAAGNVPGGRYYSASWTDGSGHFWLFGGNGNDSTGAIGELNDLWEFSPTTNQWTWMSGSSTIGAKGGLAGVYGTLGTPAAGNTPGGRSGAVSWTDASGNFWLFGGGGFDANGASGTLNDLWKFNPATNQWTWMGGSSTVIENAQGIYGRAGVYGTLGAPAAGNIPGGRGNGTTWTDKNGNLWLFGGTGFDSTSLDSSLNDLWEFNPKTNLWAWMGGPNTGNHAGVYGTQGTPAAGNIPGGTYLGSAWTDSAGNFWLFAGLGTDANGASGFLNDLWMYSPTTNQWTWVDGATTLTCSNASGVQQCFQPAVYGTLGVPAPGDIPGGRGSASNWIDSSGNLWMFAGLGFDATGTSGWLNDLWKYQLPAVALPTAATPTFSVAGGNYSSTQSVTISDTTPNATIYYTTNNTTPTSSSTVYNGTAVTVSSTETIQAIATASGFTQSADASATYTITPVVKTAPTVTVTPSPASITTAQGLTVTVTVAGTPTPTGSIVLTSGSYTSASTTLSSGSATINIPAGTLTKGTDTLTASYTPDASSSSTYIGATGSNTVAVTSPALITPTVAVTPSSSSITSAQALSVTVAVGGGSGNPTPTGALTLTSGTYTSVPVTLSGGSATINVPAGALAAGADTLTATYTPDSTSSSTYNSATGTNTVTVTVAVTPVAPTVTVTPASSSVTTAQSLSVTISLGGGPCTADRRKPLGEAVHPQACGTGAIPTGSVILSGGGYTSAAVTLANGSATITIPAGSLAVGADTLTATYTPDSNSSSIFTSATGTNTVTVSEAVTAVAPTVTVTPASSSITTAQSLSVAISVSNASGTPTGSVKLTGGGYTSAATTLASGSATITIPAGSLTAGTDTLTATYTPDSNSSSTFTSATGSNTVTVTVVVVPAPVASLTPPSLTFTATTGTTSAAQTATLTNTGNAALAITSIAVSGTNAADFAQTNTCGASLAAGANCTVSVTFAPASAATFSASISVTDNAAGSPQSVTLGGTGTPLPSFTVSSGAPSGTASATNSVTYTVTVTPQNGSIASPITFSTSGLPAGYTATFSPATLTPGSSPATTTLTIKSNPITLAQTLPLASPVLAFLGFCFIPGKRRRRLLAMCLLAVASLGGVATLSGCGGGFAMLKPTQTDTVTITASGGGETQTTTVLLTVQE